MHVEGADEACGVQRIQSTAQFECAVPDAACANAKACGAEHAGYTIREALLNLSDVSVSDGAPEIEQRLAVRRLRHECAG